MQAIPGEMKTLVILISNEMPDFFCLFMDVEKKNGAKEPRNSTPKVPPAHARAALGSMPVPPKTAKNRGILIL